MVSKGRRTSRANGLIMNPVEAVPPTKPPPRPKKLVEAAGDDPIQASPSAEVVFSGPTSTVFSRIDGLEKTTKSVPPTDPADFGRETFAVLVQSQMAAARALEAAGAELTGLAFSGIKAAARTAADMLTVKTLADAIVVNAGLTRGNLDLLVGSAVKLSELGMMLAAEISRPILTQLGKSWIKAARHSS
jgi:hypothetical protein